MLQKDLSTLQKKFKVSENKTFIMNMSVLQNYTMPLYHMNVFMTENTGDNLLVMALQKSIRQMVGPVDLINYNIDHRVKGSDLQLFNNSKGIIIGGGGLFSTTNQASISGWRLHMSSKQINKIHVPIFLLANGYNRFIGQPDFNSFFRENFNILIKKCAFAGFRNHGSINALRNYLDDDALKNKLMFHPCPTTILSKLYDIPKVKVQEPFVVLNCAFDKPQYRFQKRQDEILESTARVMAELAKDYKIKYYAHTSSDIHMLPYLEKAKVLYDLVKLYEPENVTRDFLELYAAPSLVIAMRGHAQMIPFGCGTPILSLVSHNKLAWFLDDIGHPEWSVNIQDRAYEEKLLSTAKSILSNQEKVREEIAQEKEKLFAVTKKNLEHIRDLLQ